MSVTSLALHKAVNTVWDTSGLDWSFKKYWSVSEREQFLSLDESQAMAGTPMPYCVYSQASQETIARMTKVASATGRQEFHQSLFQFHIFANTNGTKTAKDIAGELAEEILKHFGGHPTEQPKELVLDVGSVINVQYQSDYGLKLDSNVYQWNVMYLIQTDVPMAN